MRRLLGSSAKSRRRYSACAGSSGTSPVSRADIGIANTCSSSRRLSRSSTVTSGSRWRLQLARGALQLRPADGLYLAPQVRHERPQRVSACPGLEVLQLALDQRFDSWNLARPAIALPCHLLVQRAQIDVGDAVHDTGFHRGRHAEVDEQQRTSGARGRRVAKRFETDTGRRRGHRADDRVGTRELVARRRRGR